MVFIFPANSIQQYAQRIQTIRYSLPVTNTVRTAITSGNIELPGGVLLQLSFQGSGGSSYKKGECYVYLSLYSTSGDIKAVIIDDYVYNTSDAHWMGEIPVEDGDYLQYSAFVSRSDATFVRLKGYMIRV